MLVGGGVDIAADDISFVACVWVCLEGLQVPYLGDEGYTQPEDSAPLLRAVSAFLTSQLCDKLWADEY